MTETKRTEIRRGRKYKNVQFPDGEFRVSDVAQKNSVSLVTAQARCKKAIGNNELRISRKENPPRRGRKFLVLIKNNVMEGESSVG